MKTFILLLFTLTSYNSYSCSPIEINKSSKEYKEQVTRYKNNLMTHSVSILQVSIKTILNMESPNGNYPVYMMQVHKGIGNPTEKIIRFENNIMGCDTNPVEGEKYILYLFKDKHKNLMTNKELSELQIKLGWEWFHGYDKSVIYYPKHQKSQK